MRPASRLFILALAFPCAGCASWRSQTPAAPASAPGADPGGGFLQGLLQDVANASMNNWNFNKSSTDYGYPTTGDLSW